MSVKNIEKRLEKIEKSLGISKDKEQRERLNLLIPASIKNYLYAAAYRESNETHVVSVTEYLCNLVREDMIKHLGGNK